MPHAHPSVARSLQSLPSLRHTYGHRKQKKETLEMTKTRGLSRRSFLASGAAATALGMSAKSYAQVAGANNRLRVGFIGCGGMAGAHLDSLLHLKDEDNVDVVAVCDVYTTRADQFAGRVKQRDGDAHVSQDYRTVLDRGDLDYVVIATPEHSHAYLTLAALEAGKHIYCEKPMTHNVADAKKVVAAAHATNLKLQVGVQAMADDSYASALEAIRAGKLGPVVQAQIDYVRRYPLHEGPWRRSIKDDRPQPNDLDWQAWLHPARQRPWDPHRYFEWRCYRDYSGGIATDLFVHRITRIIRACNLTFPNRVSGMGGIYLWDDGRDLPDNFEMLCEYPAVDGVTPGMTVRVLGTMANQAGSEHCIRGYNATLYFTGTGWEIKSQDGGQVIETHKKTGGEDIIPHHKNHHAAIRDDVPLYCPPELGLYSVAAVRMANLSWFQRATVEWNWDGHYVQTALGAEIS
jgi:predicted dehydrogenase